MLEGLSPDQLWTDLRGVYIEHAMFIISLLPVLAAIFNLPLTPMSESVHNSSAVLAELENVGVASRIS